MLAIVGGKIYTMEGQPLESGAVLVDEGKVVEVGENISVPQGAETLDVAGKFVFPGFIDAHSHVGIIEEGFGVIGDDCNEITGPITPHLRAIDAINPGDPAFQDALLGGVTTLVSSPGSANVLGGEMVALKLYGSTVDDMIIRFPVGLKAALGENPKRSYGKLGKTPSTRMAEAALLRETFVEAQNYLQKQQARDLKLEAVARVLKGEVPLRVHAHRADDIMTAVRVAQEFNLELVIEHCTEGYKVADRLADLKIPAVIGPLLISRAKVEMRGIDIRNARALASAGVLFAIMTDHPEVPVQHLALSAALAVSGGLAEEEALKAITINPATILGLDDRIGSLKTGKDADITVFDKHPFDSQSRIEYVFINGDLVLRQATNNKKNS
ncbi:MAG TPA: amidohydrolase [Clostridia bacterium]|nr:amidohydrolase [Clostridia bacterium]